MEDETFYKVLKLYVPNFKECLEPKTRCYLHDVYKKSRSSQTAEEKAKYNTIWNNIIYNIQKYFDFYEDTVEYGNDKILVKVGQMHR